MAGMADPSRRFGPFAPALALLFLCILVNYVDRGTLSVAAPLLKDELQLSVTQLGFLLSAFFWTYTAMQFVSGWLVDRFNVIVVIAGGYLIWSMATTATGLVQGFTLLVMLRLLLGIGESVAFPACSKILACHRSGGKGNRHYGQEDRLHYSAADPEARLCRCAEIANDPVDQRDVNAEQRKLAAGGQTDV